MSKPSPIRRASSLGPAAAQTIATHADQVRELQDRFYALQQDNLPLHIYAYRALGMSSRLESAGAHLDGCAKIQVLLEGLHPRHEDIRQLLYTKVRMWKSKGEVDDDDVIFENLVTLIRRYAFEREGEEMSPTLESNGFAHDDSGSSQGAPSVMPNTGVRSSEEISSPSSPSSTSSPSSFNGEWKSTKEVRRHRRRGENLTGISIHALLGFTVPHKVRRSNTLHSKQH